jgi:hypothetical protein
MRELDVTLLSPFLALMFVVFRSPASAITFANSCNYSIVGRFDMERYRITDLISTTKYFPSPSRLSSLIIHARQRSTQSPLLASRKT